MMMDIFQRIKAFHPSLTDEDFIPIGENGTIMLVDDKDGNGPYIAKWDHPTLTKPPVQQLKDVMYGATLWLEQDNLQAEVIMTHCC